MLDLTAIVLTYNEERNLPDCLDSLLPLECVVFVVDSGSTDKTVEIAEGRGVRVFRHPFDNYGAQRNWAQANLPIGTDWVLHVDADERLTGELRRSIAEAVRSAADETSGFMVTRRTVFMGRWIKHGGHYPVYHTRLFRKDRGRCEDRLYDQHFAVDGKLERIKGDLIDTTPDLADWTARHAKWARAEAQESMLEGPQPGRLLGKPFGTPIQKRRWLRQSIYARLPLFIRPFLYFVYRYFLRLGFLDGKQGLVFHFLQGCWYRFQVDAYVLEARLTRAERRPLTSSRQADTVMPEREK